MHIHQSERRKILKALLIVGVTPVVLPGCSWIFPKRKKNTLDQSFYIIGKSQGNNDYGIYSYQKDKVQTLKKFPADFAPQSIVWGPHQKVFITGRDSSKIFVFNTDKDKLDTLNISSETTL